MREWEDWGHAFHSANYWWFATAVIKCDKKVKAHPCTHGEIILPFCLGVGNNFWQLANFFKFVEMFIPRCTFFDTLFQLSSRSHFEASSVYSILVIYVYLSHTHHYYLQQHSKLIYKFTKSLPSFFSGYTHRLWVEYVWIIVCMHWVEAGMYNFIPEWNNPQRRHVHTLQFFNPCFSCMLVLISLLPAFLTRWGWGNEKLGHEGWVLCCYCYSDMCFPREHVTPSLNVCEFGDPHP